jgi:hypothetical protein
MPAVWLMIPVFVQVALTFYLLIAMGRARIATVRRKEVRLRDFTYGGDIWPDSVKPVTNSYHNQFQLPVLFYAAVLFALVLGTVSTVFVGLAWLFVASRIVHAIVYIRFNDVVRRFRSFIAGLGILIAMWVLLAFELLARGS